MKRVLIISPHFPPVNTPDMHRVRMCLEYYESLGWLAEVICVKEEFVEGYREPLLLKTIPPEVPVHKVNAFKSTSTRRFGLGSLSMRSYFQIRKKGNDLLGNRKFDLVFFSTTAFHVCHLGVYWKKKFGVPFIIDFQDPWRNDFYLDKPRNQRPRKFFISYNIDKYLEAATMPYCDGVISVSEGYIEILRNRYPSMAKSKSIVLPFPASINDFLIASKQQTPLPLNLPRDKFNFLYMGRGGHDLARALRILFAAVKKGKESQTSLFSNVHFTFAGTSYAPAGKGTCTIIPVASEFNLQEFVTEIPDRIGYFETLRMLQVADALIIPGSTDTSYTASKIYPYLLAQKPLLAIFHKNSSVLNVLRDVDAGRSVAFGNDEADEFLVDECKSHLVDILNESVNGGYDKEAFQKYTAENNAGIQVNFFNEVLKSINAPV